MKNIMLAVIAAFAFSGCATVTTTYVDPYAGYVRYYDPIYMDYYWAPRSIHVVPGYTYRQYVRHTPAYHNVEPRYQREFGYRDSYRSTNVRGDKMHYEKIVVDGRTGREERRERR